MSFLELFFDLVWVFVVSQLSAHLLGDLSWVGAAQTTVLALSMYTIWSFSMIESTMVLARREGAGWIIIATMAGGLVMNASIPTAFTHGPWGFVVPMILIQVGRSLATRRYDVYAQLREHRLAMVAWSLVSAVPWVAGALCEPGPRLWLWVLAVAIDLAGGLLKHPVPWIRDADFGAVRLDVEHQVERTRLFLIICFGEAILTTGSALSEDVTDPARLTTALCSLAVVVALWIIFFGAASLDLSTPLDSGDRYEIDLARVGTSWLPVLLLAVIAFAVAAEEIVTHPEEPLTWALGACLTMGPATCLAARSLYLGTLSAVSGRGVLNVSAGCLVLVLVGAVILEMKAGVVMAGVALVLAVTAVSYRRTRAVDAVG